MVGIPCLYHGGYPVCVPWWVGTPCYMPGWVGYSLLYARVGMVGIPLPTMHTLCTLGIPHYPHAPHAGSVVIVGGAGRGVTEPWAHL